MTLQIRADCACGYTVERGVTHEELSALFAAHQGPNHALIMSSDLQKTRPTPDVSDQAQVLLYLYRQEPGHPIVKEMLLEALL